MKIAIFAAGTGGHIIPALEISKKFNHEEIIFFASNRPIEKAILKDKPFEVVHLNITGFRNKNFWQKFFWILSFFKNIGMVLQDILRFNPEKILLMGGYISILGLFAALILRRQIIIHEQNSVLGASNKISQIFAKKVFTTFKIGLRNEYNFGNPVRIGFEKVNYQNSGEKNKILVIGGSQGSNFLLDEIPGILIELDFKESIIIQKGGKKPNFFHKNLIYVDFIDKPSELFKDVKFIICRSGAGTIAELQTFGMPAIFIPIPVSVDNHQYKNAALAIKNGGGIIIDELSFSRDSFKQQIYDFYQMDMLDLSRKIHSKKHFNSAEKIANEIKQN